jgi:hypothetical protein
VDLVDVEQNQILDLIVPDRWTADREHSKAGHKSVFGARERYTGRYLQERRIVRLFGKIYALRTSSADTARGS